MKGDDSGASEVVDATLIVALGLVLAGIVAAFVFGVFVPVEKSAYLIPQFGILNVSDHPVIYIFDRGGDLVYLNTTPSAGHRADLYVDTKSGSFRAVPIPSLTVLRPGDTIYAYYTGEIYNFPELRQGIRGVRAHLSNKIRYRGDCPRV